MDEKPTCTRSPASIQGAPHPGTETTPRGHRIIAEPGQTPRRRRKSAPMSSVVRLCRSPAPGCTDPHCGGAEPTCPSREERERWGVAARAARPRSRVLSAAAAPGTRSRRAPPTPRPRSAPLPGPAGRARSPAADDPLPGPRQLNLHWTAGSEVARPPGAGPLGFPGYSPSARGCCEDAGRRRRRRRTRSSALCRRPDPLPRSRRSLGGCVCKASLLPEP